MLSSTTLSTLKIGMKSCLHPPSCPIPIHLLSPLHPSSLIFCPLLPSPFAPPLRPPFFIYIPFALVLLLPPPLPFTPPFASLSSLSPPYLALSFPHLFRCAAYILRNMEDIGETEEAKEMLQDLEIRELLKKKLVAAFVP